MLRRTKKFTSLLQNEGNAVDFNELAEGLRHALMMPMCTSSAGKAKSSAIR